VHSLPSLNYHTKDFCRSADRVVSLPMCALSVGNTYLRYFAIVW